MKESRRSAAAEAAEAVPGAAPEVAAQPQGGFISSIPWVDNDPDCLVLCCSDNRFEAQHRDLAHHLGFKHPHVVQVPSGPALTLPLIGAFGFLSKAIDRIMEMVIEMKHLKTVLLVGHHDCGAYRTAGNNKLISLVVQKVTGKTMHDVQHDHLVQAAKRVRIAIRGIEVKPFFADVIDAGGTKKVKFSEIKA